MRAYGLRELNDRGRRKLKYLKHRARQIGKREIAAAFHSFARSKWDWLDWEIWKDYE